MKATKRKGKTALVRADAANDVYQRIAAILEKARANAYRAVNEVMVQAYWGIGRIIVEEEQRGKKRADYGEALLAELARRLTADFGKGFDERNLRHIRQFYLTFPNRNALRSELSWTHYRLLLRVEKEEARGFYLNQAVNNRWSTRELACELHDEREKIEFEKRLQ
jgi:hypothetical protein